MRSETQINGRKVIITDNREEYKAKKTMSNRFERGLLTKLQAAIPHIASISCAVRLDRRLSLN